MLVNTKEMLQKASDLKYCIIQPNVWDLQSLRAILRSSLETSCPIIVGLAEVHFRFITPEEVGELVKYYASKTDMPIALQLDHGMTFDAVVRSIRAGFTAVMIDASSLPYEENIRVTSEVVRVAKTCNVTVEAELGHVGSGQNYQEIVINQSLLTDPLQAREFVERTQIDSLAVAVGTAHGEYNGTPKLEFQRLADIKKEVDVPLVLHGGSGTGKELLAKAVTTGISKLNVGTDLMKAARRAIHESTANLQYAEEGIVAEKAIRECLKGYIDCCGGIGKAPADLKYVDLSMIGESSQEDLTGIACSDNA
ncbi:class II fructose-bisphosphate aldolase [Propionispora vibrioides]|uniref:Fructose-bisphosphate aldolase, class II n=1 Tax=Propionispora vibrioides TaxID=112903 RepID=A0A1H8T4C7_9FIRM|nr:class II fructose-bisphosphate aldolase [Propionispora vibrioides]SEO85959.1 fructose-bisphosphate aldolase, class II [Propionispora vibrioides]